MRSPSEAKTLRILTGMDLIRPSVRTGAPFPCAGKACRDGHGADSPELGVEGTLPRRDVEDAVPYGGKDLIRPSVPPSSARRSGSRDLIRRFAPPVRLAVPENCCGLTLFLAVFDRCGKRALAFSATGSAKALFPVRGEGLWGRR